MFWNNLGWSILNIAPLVLASLLAFATMAPC